jgi:DNA topoisomerase-1
MRDDSRGFDQTGKHLVIVESPAKAKTINKYLGDDYIVRASMGHVRDLPSKGMGVDLKTFSPNTKSSKSRGKVISELKKLAKESDDIYLATDLDREGEAIAWHLKEALGIPDERVKRVIFNAITKSEIQKAFAKPHAIDIDRVNAQQARRILDRIVGYEISPLLWRKVAKGLSAGRVQSVTVRLVVEREREIEAFHPQRILEDRRIFTATG